MQLGTVTISCRVALTYSHVMTISCNYAVSYSDNKFQSCFDLQAGNDKKIVSKYDQEIPQSQTADYPVAPRGRTPKPSRDIRKTN